MRTSNKDRHDGLGLLCESIRALVSEGAYEACIDAICKAMENYPHAPHPHNLMGIVLEKTGDHPAAMKHFRAAWALDPTYLPASHNLNLYGTFVSRGCCAFDESDLTPKPPCTHKVTYDERGVGHVTRR